MKLCRKCGGLMSPKGLCNPCKAKSVAVWRLANLERANEIAKKSRTKNRDKCRARASAWYAANRIRAKAAYALRRKIKPDAVKNGKLIASFGITLQQYNTMAGLQGFKCAICRMPQAEQRRKMAVDHNHNTGAIRGLLCHNCNVGMGNFKDSETLLEKAASYLKFQNSLETIQP